MWHFCLRRLKVIAIWDIEFITDYCIYNQILPLKLRKLNLPTLQIDVALFFHIFIVGVFSKAP